MKHRTIVRIILITALLATLMALELFVFANLAVAG